MWIYLYSQNCAAITITNNRMSHYQKRKPAPHSCNPPNPLLPITHPPQPQATANLLSSLWICLFWTFHRNETIQPVFFGDRLLSFIIMFWGFICVVTCISSFLLLLTNTSLNGYTTFYNSYSSVDDISVDSTFWLVRMMLSWPFANKFLCGHMFVFLSGICRGAELLGHLGAL